MVLLLSLLLPLLLLLLLLLFPLRKPTVQSKLSYNSSLVAMSGFEQITTICNKKEQKLNHVSPHVVPVGVGFTKSQTATFAPRAAASCDNSILFTCSYELKDTQMHRFDRRYNRESMGIRSTFMVIHNELK